MATGITRAFSRGFAKRGTTRVQDADTSLVTHNSAAVATIPIPTSGKALLQVNVASFTGGTNVTVKLQHSVDGVSFLDISGATTAALTATGTVVVAFNGFVGPYVRAVSTVTGTFTVLSVTTDVYATD